MLKYLRQIKTPVCDWENWSAFEMQNSPSHTMSLTGFDSNDLLNRAIEAHYAEITDVVSRRGHSRSSASDIVHDLYVKLATRPDVLRDKRSIKTFLFRSAVNLGIDRLRRQKTETRLFSGTEQEALCVESDLPAPDYGLDIEARVAILRDAIAELPPRRRAVFILHRLHHLNADEIARKLNISRNMVDRHLRRSLAHCLDRLLEFN